MKKLIKKGQGGFALLANNISQNINQKLAQPSYGFKLPFDTKSSGNLNTLFNNEIKTSNNMPTFLTGSPNKDSIVQGLNKTLFDKGFQDRMAKGQADYAKSQANAARKDKWNNFKEGAGEFIKSDAGKAMGSMIGSGVDAISANVGEGDRSTISSGLSIAGDALMGVNPLIGLGVKGLGLLNQATSKQTNTNISSGIAGYGGSDINESKTFDGINRLLGNDTKYKASLKQRKQLAMAGKINAQDQLKQGQARLQSIGNTGMDNQKKLSGGLDFSVLTAKKGATLQDIRNYIKVRNIEKEVVQNPNLEDNLEKSEIQKFQNGGSLIPSGALHKNKHKLESINPELKGEITGKGIPVISYAEKGDILEYEEDGETPKVLAEGGEIIQHAEIEKDEVILNLSLTKKLIELMKKNTPEAMIEAGKILARELMEDTTDNTGLLEKTIGNEN